MVYLKYLKKKSNDLEDDEAPATWEGRMNQTKTEIKKVRTDLDAHLDLKISEETEMFLKNEIEEDKKVIDGYDDLIALW